MQKESSQPTTSRSDRDFSPELFSPSQSSLPHRVPETSDDSDVLQEQQLTQQRKDTSHAAPSQVLDSPPKQASYPWGFKESRFVHTGKDFEEPPPQCTSHQGALQEPQASQGGHHLKSYLESEQEPHTKQANHQRHQWKLRPESEQEPYPKQASKEVSQWRSCPHPKQASQRGYQWGSSQVSEQVPRPKQASKQFYVPIPLHSEQSTPELLVLESEEEPRPKQASQQWGSHPEQSASKCASHQSLVLDSKREPHPKHASQQSNLQSYSHQSFMPESEQEYQKRSHFVHVSQPLPTQHTSPQSLVPESSHPKQASSQGFQMRGSRFPLTGLDFEQGPTPSQWDIGSPDVPFPIDSFSDSYWTDEDSDYLTSTSLGKSYCV